MLSTFSTFPTSKEDMDRIKIPFVIYVNPIKENLPVISSEFSKNIPKCSSCSAYFNGFCCYSKSGWTCSNCGSRYDLLENQIPHEVISTPSYQILNKDLSFELTHVIIIGSGNISFAKSIMQSLPNETPVQVFIFNSKNSAQQIIGVSNNLKQLNALPNKAIKVNVKTAIQLLLNLLSFKKCCFWCRVFCNGGEIDEKVINMMKRFLNLPIRVDFFLDSYITGTSAESFKKNCFGVCRFFNSFDFDDSIDSAADTAAMDCSRQFGFQCKVRLKCGLYYKAVCDFEKPVIPVIASPQTSIPFIITPPYSGKMIAFQLVQMVAHVHIWDPPTNLLHKTTNIINMDFPVTSSKSDLLSSISPSVLFDFWNRHNQRFLIEKLKHKFENLKILISMNQRANLIESQRFENFKFEFFSLCTPTTWRWVLDIFVETLNDKKSNEVAVYIIKHFPKIIYAIKDGTDVLIGDSIKNYIEMCRPLAIKIEKVPFEKIQKEIPKS